MTAPALRDLLEYPEPLVLRNARIPDAMISSDLPKCGDGLVSADIRLANGRMTMRAPDPSADYGARQYDLRHSMVWALPIDCHTHIDKGQVWARTQNPDGTFTSALECAARDARDHFSSSDLETRARFILDCAVAHGTGALRTHVDAEQAHFDTAFGVLRDVSSDYADRLVVQLAPFTGMGEPPEFIEHVARTAKRSGSGVLSVFVQWDTRLDEFLNLIFGMADRLDLALDFHADETLDPKSHCSRAIANAALRHKFERPIVIGHLCSLSVQNVDELDLTAGLLAQAGVRVAALPLCNSYLQDRRVRASPKFRGVAPVHELSDKGIDVAIASDNVRDPFHAYGDMDMVELFRFSLAAMHLDHSVGQWPGAVTTIPADIMGLPDLGRLRQGGPADLMILKARNWSEFGARPPSRTVLRAGLIQDTTPPDFARLDQLEGMTP